MMTTLVRLFGGCDHSSTYRERRPLHGVEVMHLVCLDCGHAVPAVQRSAVEHEEAVRAGAVRVPRAHRKGTALVELTRRSA